MLTRQWQFGEFHGEDAGSAVMAMLARRLSPVVEVRVGRGASPSPTTRRCRWRPGWSDCPSTFPAPLRAQVAQHLMALLSSWLGATRLTWRLVPASPARGVPAHGRGGRSGRRGSQGPVARRRPGRPGPRRARRPRLRRDGGRPVAASRPRGHRPAAGAGRGRPHGTRRRSCSARCRSSATGSPGCICSRPDGAATGWVGAGWSTTSR